MFQRRYYPQKILNSPDETFTAKLSFPVCLLGGSRSAVSILALSWRASSRCCWLYNCWRASVTAREKYCTNPEMPEETILSRKDLHCASCCIGQQCTPTTHLIRIQLLTKRSAHCEWCERWRSRREDRRTAKAELAMAEESKMTIGEINKLRREQPYETEQISVIEYIHVRDREAQSPTHKPRVLPVEMQSRP